MSIYGNVDSYGDVMVPGAFDESIATRGLPFVSFEHMWDFTGPIGELTAAEDDDIGLKVAGQLYIDDPFVSRVYRAAKAGGIRDMSFAYIAGDTEEIDDDNAADYPAGATRAVKSVEWLEAGIVVKGANPEAGLLQVASHQTRDLVASVLDFDSAVADEEFMARLEAEIEARNAQRLTGEERQAYLRSLTALRLSDLDTPNQGDI